MCDAPLIPSEALYQLSYDGKPLQGQETTGVLLAVAVLGAGRDFLLFPPISARFRLLYGICSE